MTTDELVSMAREVGAQTSWYGTLADGTNEFLGANFTKDQLARFAALVAKAEREKAARVCDQLGEKEPITYYYECAEAIREMT